MRANRLTITAAAAVAVVSAGAYLRWSVKPVLMAYEVGRQAERIINGQEAAAR
jgi:hypothetical protein